MISPIGRILMTGVILERTVSFVERYGIKDEDSRWEYDGNLSNLVLLRDSTQVSSFQLPLPYPLMMIIAFFPSLYDRLLPEN
jgi:hypothetical protein